MTESLSSLVEMYKEREQHVGEIAEHKDAISEIDKRFDPNRDLLMIDLGFKQMNVKGRTYFVHPYQDSRHVLQAGHKQVSLWEITNQNWKDFKKYLSQSSTEWRKDNNLIYGAGVGIVTGIGTSLLLIELNPSSTIPDLGYVIGILGTSVIGGYIGNKVDNARWNKVKERRERYKPIAEGTEALEKVVELYPNKT